jgi:hypothetical protein
MIFDVIHHLHALAGDVGTVLAAPSPGAGTAPDPGAGTAPPGAAKIITILKWAKWLFTAAAVLAALGIAGKMAIAHRRGDDTNVAHLGVWLAACVLAGIAPSIVDALI